MDDVILRFPKSKIAIRWSEVAYVEELEDGGLNINFKSGENVLVEDLTLTDFFDALEKSQTLTNGAS